MKKLICLVLIFTMMLTACSKWEIEIVDPTKPVEGESELIVPEDEKPEGNEPENTSGEESETSDDFHARMEYEDFYTALVEIKGAILPEMRKAVSKIISLGEEYLYHEYHIESGDFPDVEKTEDFSIRKTYEKDGKVTYYSAVPVKNKYEIRMKITEIEENNIKIWKPGEAEIASLYGNEEFYDWELSDIPAPKNYPTRIQSGLWKTNNTDWFGQENPFEQKFGPFEHLECRNWTNAEEYINASFAVPVAYSPDVERAFGQINMTLPERVFFENSTICWDGNFGEDELFGGPNLFKIGELRFFEEWHEPDENELSGKIESEKIGLDKIKITEKYIRTFGDIYSSGVVEIVDYRVNVGGGFGVSVYFYISESLTEEDIEIYDRIVESMVFEDMR